MGGWHPTCAIAVLTDVRKLQNLTPGEIVILSDIFRQVGAKRLAGALTGALPFDDVPREGLLQ